MASRTLLFLVTEDWYFASHRLPLAEAAVRAGYRVLVATRVQRHELLLREAGCEVIPLRWRRSGDGLLDHAKAVGELIALYRKVRPDLVHHVALKPVVFGSIAARAAGIGAIVNAVAGMGNLGGASGWATPALRISLNFALRAVLDGARTRVIFQNPDDRNDFIRAGIVNPDRTVLIRGAGVNLRLFKPSARTGQFPVVLLPGRMLKTKGVREFVEAAGRLHQEGVKARFVLVGDRDPANADSIPQEQLEAWDATGLVEWWGFRKDVPAVVSEADIVCLPSYREGLPKALLEAAAAGLPIVTTDVPGCREVVRHGDNGLLVPARDAAALADALRILIADRPLRERMGRRSRAIAEAEFSDEAVACATLAIYRELLG